MANLQPLDPDLYIALPPPFNIFLEIFSNDFVNCLSSAAASAIFLILFKDKFDLSPLVRASSN